MWSGERAGASSPSPAADVPPIELRAFDLIINEQAYSQTDNNIMFVKLDLLEGGGYSPKNDVQDLLFILI